MSGPGGAGNNKTDLSFEARSVLLGYLYSTQEMELTEHECSDLQDRISPFSTSRTVISPELWPTKKVFPSGLQQADVAEARRVTPQSC
mmetsp:Transcript_5918/g.14387  ORF Transcript_5918/g.14387 Transcript_5918/m.14387 type:complete len:88 (+) Transcript_5918:870-1133(+)